MNYYQHNAYENVDCKFDGLGLWITIKFSYVNNRNILDTQI